MADAPAPWYTWATFGLHVRGGMKTICGHQLSCDICGGPMVERKCKIICTNCGYTRDCSDP